MWKKFGGLAGICFLQSDSFFISLQEAFALKIGVNPSVFSSPLWSFFSLFSLLQDHRVRERERERGGGGRSGCLKVCGRHVTCCTLLALIFLFNSGFETNYFDSSTRLLLSFSQQINFRDAAAQNRGTRTQKFKWGGGRLGREGGGWEV